MKKGLRLRARGPRRMAGGWGNEKGRNITGGDGSSTENFTLGKNGKNRGQASSAV